MSFLKRNAKKIVANIGLEVQRKRPVFSGWKPEKINGFAPNIKTCIDIGVAYGTPILYESFPHAYHVLIEPIEKFKPDLEKILEKYEGKYLITAVGAAIGYLPITIELDNITSTSFLKRTDLTARAGRKITKEVPITTLDKLLEDNSFQPPFALKVDTEGYELQVILGAEKFLKKTELVIAEVSYDQRFQGSYQFAEFTEAMVKQRFYLHDLLNVNGVRCVDAVFKKIPE